MAKFSSDEKLQAVIRYQIGTESMKSIAKSIGLHPTVLLNWIRQYEYHGEGIFKKRYTAYSVQDKLDVFNHMKEYGRLVERRLRYLILRVIAPF